MGKVLIILGYIVAGLSFVYFILCGYYALEKIIAKDGSFLWASWLYVIISVLGIVVTCWMLIGFMKDDETPLFHWLLFAITSCVILFFVAVFIHFKKCEESSAYIVQASVLVLQFAAIFVIYLNFNELIEDDLTE